MKQEDITDSRGRVWRPRGVSRIVRIVRIDGEPLVSAGVYDASRQASVIECDNGAVLVTAVRSWSFASDVRT